MPRQKIAGKKMMKSSASKSKTSVASGSKASKSTMNKKKTAPAEGGVKSRNFRYRPGTVALREIKRY